MYDRILVAVDNSTHSGYATGHAMALAGAFRSTVVGAHVYAARLHDRRFRDLEPGLPAEQQAPDKLEASRRTHDSLIEKGLHMISASYLDATAKRAAEAGVPFERRNIEGKHHLKLVEESGRGYALTMVGAWGLGRATLNGQASPHILGTVCERVVRGARTDVWIARTGRPVEGAILACVDGSPDSYAALRRAINIAQRLGASVEAVACFDPHFHPVAFRAISDVLSAEASRIFRFKEQERLHDEIIDHGLEKVYTGYLDNAGFVARGKGFPIATRLLKGKPAFELAARARECDASLIVVARHGLHHVDGIDIGSTAEAVARLVDTNVLIVNERAAAEPIAWTAGAEARLEKVPPFMRPMVRRAVESHARARGIAEIDDRVVDEAKRGHGVPIPGHEPEP